MIMLFFVTPSPMGLHPDRKDLYLYLFLWRFVLSDLYLYKFNYFTGSHTRKELIFGFTCPP